MAQLSALFKSRGRLLIILSVVIIIIISVSLTMGMIPIGKNSPPSAIASTDKTVVRLGESISFSAKGSKGDIRTYLWDFGDGNESTGIESSHAYEDVGFYNVSLTVIDSGDRSDNCSLTVGIQRGDFDSLSSSGANWDIRPRMTPGTESRETVGPNIGGPEIDVGVRIANPVGQFVVQIRTHIVNAYVTILTEILDSTGSNIDWSHSIAQEDLPEDMSSNPSEIVVVVMIDQGYYSSVQISLKGTFPTDITI